MIADITIRIIMIFTIRIIIMAISMMIAMIPLILELYKMIWAIVMMTMMTIKNNVNVKYDHYYNDENNTDNDIYPHGNRTTAKSLI